VPAQHFISHLKPCACQGPGRYAKVRLMAGPHIDGPLAGSGITLLARSLVRGHPGIEFSERPNHPNHPNRPSTSEHMSCTNRDKHGTAVNLEALCQPHWYFRALVSHWIYTKTLVGVGAFNGPCATRFPCGQ
jgi:hypothetical protein